MRAAKLVVLTCPLAAPIMVAGQPCSSQWDGAIGRPGVTSTGYIGPMRAWDDGRGGGSDLYVGGSFASIGGGAHRGIARWDPDAARWNSVGGGCFSTGTNYFVAAIQPHSINGLARLYAGGSFQTAGGVTGTANFARWDGIAWSPVGNISGAVWTMASWNGVLYVGGGFSTINATLSVNGIAAYMSDEAGWMPLGQGMAGGFSPGVFALKVFNDGSGEKLYAGGRFASLGGVNGLVARWDGNGWQSVGAGVLPNGTFADIECMAVFNDGSGPALYVGGSDLLPGGQAVCNVAKWNGTTWARVGQNLGGRTTGLAVFDDGTGEALYATGTAQPGVSYLARLQGGQWVTAWGGVGQNNFPPFPSAFGIYAWGSSLYVGGDFDYADGGATTASGIVARRGCAVCDPDISRDGIADQEDVSRLIDLVAGGFNPEGLDGDFDRDGTVDQGDVLQLIWVIAGAPCP